MKRMWSVLVACLAIALGVAACSRPVSAPAAPFPTRTGAAADRATFTAIPTETPVPARPQAVEEVTMTPQGKTWSTPAPPWPEQVTQARADLARRLSIELDQIDVVDVGEVEWRDTSLGCPQPGMMYAQVITPGYRIVLQAGGQEYVYHTDKGTAATLCEDTSSSGRLPKGGDTTVEDGWPSQPKGSDVVVVPPSERK